MLKVKRVYEKRHPDDGIRILVDRLWPRGLASTSAGLDEWAKELAPSDQLRRWFGHNPERWPGFRQKYREELRSPPKTEALLRIVRMADKGKITLLYGAKDTERNNARVLAEVINENMKITAK